MAKQKKNEESPKKVTVNDGVSQSASGAQQNAPAPDAKAKPAAVHQLSETKRRIDS